MRADGGRAAKALGRCQLPRRHANALASVALVATLLTGCTFLKTDNDRNCEATLAGIAHREATPNAEQISGSYDEVGDRYFSYSGCQTGDIDHDLIGALPCYATAESLTVAGTEMIQGAHGLVDEPGQYAPVGSDCGPGDIDLRTQ